jgi:hypothetical protein
MQKIIIPLLCLLLFTSSVRSQTTIACQFTNSNGYTYEGGRWKRSGFIVDKPFFIKIKPDGIIDESSLKGVDMYFEIKCKRPFGNVRQELVICHETTDSLVLNTKTLEGAISSLAGAGSSSNNKRDDVVIKLFNCQPM